MNFFDMCKDLFERMSEIDDLKKDVQIYKKWQYYITNFWLINREDIEKFIVDVRSDNVLYSAICQVKRMVMYGPLKRLDELPLPELYNELSGEEYNIVLKGAYDSVKVLNELTNEQDKELQNKFANEDITIFMQYKCR
ncbi:MAG: hypothetical protein HDT40_07695 [Lachnospiraceae bacterium]|nr:hypothetical protein [Lachnospiraceae bacterium]